MNQGEQLVEFILFIVTFIEIGLVITYVIYYIRETIIDSFIKKYSDLYLKQIKINENYNNRFFYCKNDFQYYFRCNSLSQYRNNDNTNSIVDFLCHEVIKKNESVWHDLCDKINRNNITFKFYKKDINLLQNQYLGTSFNTLKHNFLFRLLLLSENSFIAHEKSYCNKKILNPVLNLEIDIKISYISPARRNYYYSEYELDKNDVERCFKRLKARREYEKTSKYQRSLITPSMRYDILKRDNYTCQLCGRSPKKDGITLEVDHIFPVSKGGTSTPENLQTLCHDCNSGKSDKI